MMLLPQRLEMALNKLYTAFYDERLDPENCCHCAVGNICDNADAWKHFTDVHGTVKLNYLGRLHQALGKRINGYAPSELLSIEAVFLKGCGYTLTSNKRLIKPAPSIDRDMIFKGLYATVNYLCKLDGVQNVMEQYKEFDLTTSGMQRNSEYLKIVD